VKTENNEYLTSNAVYFPDPITGALYKLRLQDNGGTNNELKKLPFTIQELVTKSPCKSSDGILFSGKKSDFWFLIDPSTGRKEFVMGFGTKSKSNDVLGYATSRSVYLGR
jgi:serine/threonine-protein kinase/endoribonuclease IRE1